MKLACSWLLFGVLSMSVFCVDASEISLAQEKISNLINVVFSFLSAQLQQLINNINFSNLLNVALNLIGKRVNGSVILLLSPVLV